MKANFRTETKSELLSKREQAVIHLERLRETMQSNQQWLPAIAQAVQLELINFIELCNERLELIEDRQSPVKYEEVVQLAFDFLFACTIAEDEIPF